MLYGGYDHNIDKKGRVFIPSRLKEDLGESFIVCRGISGKRCLCIYPFNEWEKLVAKISELPSSQASSIKRFIFDGAFNVEFDTRHRAMADTEGLAKAYPELKFIVSVSAAKEDLPKYIAKYVK